MPRKTKPLTIAKLLSQDDVCVTFENLENRLSQIANLVIVSVDMDGVVGVDFEGMSEAEVIGVLFTALQLVSDYTRIEKEEN